VGVVSSSSPAAPAPPSVGVIAFASNRSPVPVRQNDFDIYTMRADGTGVRRLTADPANDDQPTWSADGRRLAFVRCALVTGGRGDCRHLCVITLGRRGARCFTTEFQVFRPAWSPRDDSIAYVSYHDGRSRIILLDPRNGTRRALPGVEQPDVGGVSWSPDGARIVFSSAGSLHLIELANDAVTDLTGRRCVNGSCIDGYDRWPAWAPDGRSILFWSRGRPPYPYGLYAVDPAVGETSLRTILPGYYHPAWSPDGTRLAADLGVIYVAKTDGGGFTPITRNLIGSLDEFPAWRPLAADFSAARPSLGPVFRNDA
jgi:TolB protein